MNILQIRNGWLLVSDDDPSVIIYCKDQAAVHQELEILIGGGASDLPPAPSPPTDGSPAGVRQFDDED